MTSYEQLKKKICEALPRLLLIKNGQFFYSKFDGQIVATRIDLLESGSYHITGHDTTTGLSRSNHYPRDLELLGIEPTLSDCLAYIKEILKKESSSLSIQELLAFWNLSQPLLKDQSEELIDYLLRL